jgi:hypothetical protein
MPRQRRPWTPARTSGRTRKTGRGEPSRRARTSRGPGADDNRDRAGYCVLRPVVTVSRPVGGVLSSASRRLGGHPSVRSTWGCRLAAAAGPAVPLFDLAPGGVYRAARVTPGAGALLPHRFTLACGPPVAGTAHRRSVLCGTVLRVTPTGSRQHPALWSPDLPRRRPRSPGPAPRPPGRLTVALQYRRSAATSASRRTWPCRWSGWAAPGTRGSARRRRTTGRSRTGWRRRTGATAPSRSPWRR